MASAMVMPTPTPEPAPALFSEGDPLVLVVYFSTFLIWTAAAGNDFISSSWRTVGDTRRRGKLHVALVFIPMTLITAYIAFQHITKDYKEMGAALIALAFALLHLSRTFMGLWQLHVFKQWAISSIKSMESLGYETRLQEGAAPCVEDADTDEEEDDVGSESESDSAPSSEEADSDEEEGNVGTESERSTAPRGVQIDRDEEEDNVGSENGSGAVEERKGGDNSEEEIVNEAQGDAKSNGGRSDGGNGGNAQQRGCWFPGLLKKLPCASTKGAEWERIERIADDILVNDTLIDNRLSDVHTVCNFRFLSKAEEKMVRRVRLPSKDKVKTVKGALKGALLTLKRLCLRIRYGFPRAFCVFRVLYSLAFLKNPHMPNLHSAPRLVPRRPESIWPNWAAALVAQAGWVLHSSVLVDPDPSAGYAENRNRSAEQVLLSAALHTRRMTAARTSTSGRNEDGDRMSGFVSFRDWHKYPELRKGKFSKQEWLKRACRSGNGLPYRVRHRRAKESKDRWGYSNFKSELLRACEALPPELETRVQNFDVEQLEWFTIFVSIENWAPGVEKKDESASDDSKSSSNSTRNVKVDNVEPENDIPFENLKKQLGFDSQLTCMPGPEQEGEPESRLKERFGCTPKPNVQNQLGDAKESKFVLGSFMLPYMRNLLRVNLWGNRNILEVSCHVDNWIALCAGEQTFYMVERVSKMEEDLSLAYALRSIDRIVAASAKFEYCRFLCQMAIICPEHNHFDKSMTFLGCSMEMLRSSLAKWAEAHGDSEEGTWKPRLSSNFDFSGTTKRGILSRLEGSDDFTSCLRSVKSQAAMSKSFVKMRVLWELQNHFQTQLLKNEFTPNSLEAIALCILSFPALSVKVIDRRDSSATFRMALIEMVEGRGKCCVTLHCEDEEKFRIEKYEYVIHASCGPQDLQLVLSFKPLRENSNAALSILLCEIEGGKVDYFDWEVWRSAFYGRLEGCRQWKAKVGISNFALVAPTEHINAGIWNVAGSTTVTDTECDIGTNMSVWKGWPPHCASICMYELTTEEFIFQPHQVEGAPVPLSMGDGTTFPINIPQEIWEPVKYAEANELSLKKASLVAQNLLTRNEDIALARSSDIDVSAALHVATVGERDVEALKQEILLLESNMGRKEAVLRGVACLERFYVYGTHRPEKSKRTTHNLLSFFCNEKYLTVVTSLFKKMFEASEYDKYVAERYQLFLTLGMFYGADFFMHEEVCRENAFQVMFRSIVHRCYNWQVSESAAKFLVSVLPLQSEGSFEEYAALILAYLNAGREVEAALQRRPGHNSLLEGVRDAISVRKSIVIGAVVRIEGGLRFLEALGLSANDAGNEAMAALRVSFRLQSPLGPWSVAIFMKYATGSSRKSGEGNSPIVAKILIWCKGLPIALVVAGSAVSLLVRHFGSFERACEVYVTDFEEMETNLGDEEDPQGTTFGIHLSLKYLDAEFSKWKERQAVDTEHIIRDLYTSLCVLRKQGSIPVSVLSRMWQLCEKSALAIVDLFCGLSLATLSFGRFRDGTVEKAGLRLHDLHLEFCKQQAGRERMELLWHSALLNGYLDAPSDSVFSEQCTLSSQQVLDVTPRSWWSIPEDGYIHENLARHLLFSDRRAELAVLLLDARWANVRGKFGGILGLKADFEILDDLLERGGSGDGENNSSKGIRKSFQSVGKALQLSWGSFSDGQRALQFQMYGRLLTLRNDVIIDSVIKSFEAHTPKPYLMPVSRFFPELNSAQVLEIPVGGWCGWLDRSPCGRYIAAGAGCDIVVADLMTGDVLKRLNGHLALVGCVRFAGSQKIVSASEDRTVAVWEWEESDTPILVLEGHSDEVTSVDISSDGKFVLSGSRDCTVRLWNGLTGLQTGEFMQSSEVICVSLCSEDKKVAVGLCNGTAKVLDSCTGDTLFEDTEAHAEIVTCVAFSPDGRRMATCSWDKTIRIWDTEKWAAIGSPVEGHAEAVSSVAFSPDGRQLVSGSLDGSISLWNVAPAEYAGASSNRLVLSERNFFSSEYVTSVTFTCDGKRIVSGSGSGIVRMWDAAFASKEEQRSSGLSASVLSVSISPDGLRVATGSRDKTVRLWDSQTGAQIGIALEGHTDVVTCVSFSPDGQHLVSGSSDRTLRMWDTGNFVQLGSSFAGHSDSVCCVSFSCDGLRIVSGGDDKTVRLWNVETREQIGDPLIGHVNRVMHVYESSDGRFVVSRDLAGREEEGETIIWNRNSSSIVWRSNERDGDANNRISNIEAESIIRSCGYETPHLWPSCFPDYTAELFCKDYIVYSTVLEEKILVGNLPSHCMAWKYDVAAKVLAAVLDNGGVAICRLVM